MSRRRTALLLGLLGACLPLSPQRLAADGPTKPRHANEIAASDDLPTMAGRPDPAGTVPERGDTAVLTLLQDIDGFNPFTSSSVDASEVQELIYPRLMIEEPDYYAGPPHFTPNIAEKWEAGADGRSVHFTLRETTWSDGTPITSDDVRFSWEAARHPKVAWNSASIVDFISDVEVKSPREFIVRYTETYPYQVMDINDVHILPRHVYGKVPFETWQQHGDWTEQARVSGGPWVLDKYVANQEISFLPNPRYWDKGKPYLARAVFKVVGSMETNLTSLLSGDVDFMTSVLPKDSHRVLGDGDLLLYTFVTRGMGWVGWNCRKAPFDDVRVRRALSLAIDRENIVESVLYGYGKVAGPIIIRSMWASNHDIAPAEFDPDAAEAQLEAAGWKRAGDGTRTKDGKPFAFKLVTNAGNDVRKKICEYVQKNLHEVGVAVEIVLQDFNQMSQQLKRHNFDAYVGGMYFATKVDGKPIFHSQAAEGRFNYVDYRNARVDEIIDAARTMSDKATAKPLWDEMQKIMADEQPYAPLYEPRGLVGLSKRFRGVKVNSLRALANLHEWWVPKAEHRYK